MPDSRPNIIFIITDQQRYDTISEHRQKREELLRVLLNWRLASDNHTADWTESWR